MSASDCILIRNGRIVDPASGRDEIGDIAVADGKIVPALSAEQAARARVIDAAGTVVAPGFVDLNAHIY